MKFLETILAFSIALVIGFVIGQYTAPSKYSKLQDIKPDTVYVPKLVPKYYTKIEYRESQPDTSYVAEADTTIGDSQIKVTYESLYPIPTGTFSISGIISPKVIFPVHDYYIAASISSSMIDGTPEYTAEAGRYLFYSNRVKVGIGAFITKRPDIIDGGLRLTVRMDF